MTTPVDVLKTAFWTRGHTLRLHHVKPFGPRGKQQNKLDHGTKTELVKTVLYVWDVVAEGDFTSQRMFYVYILQSFIDKSLYIGFTPDLKKRVFKHNKKQVSSTKSKVPWRLIYYESYLLRKDATGREKFLKSGSGWRFIKKQLRHYFNEYS